MGATVTVNKRTVVHAQSGGKAIASAPDVCKTPSPGGPAPIPYPNIAQSTDTAKGSRSVLMDGESIMLKDSEFSTSTGDEAGTAGGGLVSSKTKGKAKFVAYSFDVKVEGKNVPRLGDAMSNNGNSPNTAALVLVQGNITTQSVTALAQECEKKIGQPEKPKDCKKYGERKHECCEDAIHEEQSRNEGSPQLYSEGAFSSKTGDMIPRNNPMGGMPGQVPRLRQAIKKQAIGLAKKKKLPFGSMIASFFKGKMIFPDLVVPDEPGKPIGPGNVKNVYDFYFPCPPGKKTIPKRKKIQMSRYKRLLKPQNFPEIISP
ncbi:DUF4150 domain-containing protein [Archangium sp.]|uniref:DUF4150 domain-containing protein n=1 Tax=Archangium sp. TaxID=1872627 RepID=UPI0039C89397